MNSPDPTGPALVFTAAEWVAFTAGVRAGEFPTDRAPAFRCAVVNTGAVDRDGTVALLKAILADLPRLDGASCIGQFALYDVLPGREPERSAAERERLQAAVELCAGCPARGRCPESLSRNVTGNTSTCTHLELIGPQSAVLGQGCG